MRIKGNRKKSRDHKWLRYEKEAMFCYFCRKSKKTNPFASAEGCTNFCPPKNKNVPQNFSQGDKLSPSGQILAQTLTINVILLDIANLSQIWSMLADFKELASVFQPIRNEAIPRMNDIKWNLLLSKQMNCDLKELKRKGMPHLVPSLLDSSLNQSLSASLLLLTYYNKIHLL